MADYKIFERNDRATSNDIPEEECEVLLKVQNLNELCRCAKDSEVIKRAIEANKGIAIAIDKIAIKAREAAESLQLRPTVIYNAWVEYKETKNHTLLENLYKRMGIQNPDVFLATQMPQWKYVWRYVNRYKWSNESEEDAVVRQSTIEMICEIIMEYKRMEELGELEKGEPQRENPKGRKVRPFIDNVCPMNDKTKEEILNEIHKMADGKTGTNLVRVLKAFMAKGYLLKPTFTQAQQEFKTIGSQSAYKYAMNNHIEHPSIDF